MGHGKKSKICVTYGRHYNVGPTSTETSSIISENLTRDLTCVWKVEHKCVLHFQF